MSGFDLGVVAASGAGFDIRKSLMMDGAAHHMTRSFSGAPDSTQVFSKRFLAKRSPNGAEQRLWRWDQAGVDFFYISFDASGRIDVWYRNAAATTIIRVVTANTFQDTSKFYDVLVTFNTNAATNTDRAKIYVDRVRQTTFNGSPTWPGLGAGIFGLSNLGTHYIGRNGSNASSYFNGYLAYMQGWDGIEVVPDDVSEDDGQGGSRLIDPSGLARGTNGYLLTAADGTSLATLGHDEGAGSNDWTLNGMALSDQRTDTPTNNACIFNSLKATDVTLSEGALVATGDGALAWDTVLGTLALTDTHYFEIAADVVHPSVEQSIYAGFWNTGGADPVANDILGLNKLGIALNYNNSPSSAVQTSQDGVTTGFTETDDLANGNVIQCAIDVPNQLAWFGRDNNYYDASIADIEAGLNGVALNGTNYVPAVSVYGNASVTLRITEDSWSYPAPSGFRPVVG